MITADGKCDGKCNTCNIVQQSYCNLVKFKAEQDKVLYSRLDHIEETIAALDRRLNSELFIAQGGDGAEKVSESTTINPI